MMNAQFLVIEDQPLLREMICSALQQAEFNVSAFESVEAFNQLALSPTEFRIAIVDLTLPGMSGLDFCQRLRKASPEMGIIMLTMHKTIEKKLQGYAAGIDLYLTKPIDNQELVAAAKALLKRLPLSDSAETQVVQFDQVKQKIWGSGVCENLSFKEAKTLSAFLKAKNNQLEHWELLEINQLAFDEKGRKQLEVRISRLRQKLKKFSPDLHTIQPIRGYGYQLNLSITSVGF